MVHTNARWKKSSKPYFFLIPANLPKDNKFKNEFTLELNGVLYICIFNTIILPYLLIFAFDLLL